MNDCIKSKGIENNEPFDFGSLLPCRDLEKATNKNFEQIDFIREWLEATYKEKLMLEKIEQQLQDGQLAKGKLNDLRHALIFGKLNALENLETNLYIAFIYNCIARNLANEDRLILSWKAINEASTYLGHSNEIHSHLTNTKRSNAKAGGEGKALASIEIKKLAITTLIKYRPSKGWGKISTATEKIMDRYDELSATSAFKIKREDALTRIINLLHEDKLTRLIFASE